MTKRTLKAKKIGVLLGGSSAEREVSLKSGNAVFQALKACGYNAVAIDAACDLCAVLRQENIDIAFIALHGGHGENGALQGMLEVMNIPYTGSGVLASALAMDKEASKKMFIIHEVPVPRFLVLDKSAGKEKGSAAAHYAALVPFGMPWVVKPASEGSSVGVEIVREKKGFAKALKQAFAYGDRVLVEQYIQGQEVQIGILNQKVLGGVEVKPSHEFYSYEAKYTAGLTEYIFPPGIDNTATRKANRAALAAHKALGCSGATRVDLIVDGEGNPYVLEVNTIPGMTETSLLPKIAKNAGYEFPVLIEKILLGLECGTEKGSK